MDKNETHTRTRQKQSIVGHFSRSPPPLQMTLLTEPKSPHSSRVSRVVVSNNPRETLSATKASAASNSSTKSTLKNTRIPSSVTQTYYYANSSLFEQSLDVFTPSIPDPSLPLVLLVVGSGWLGHHSFIYSGCSWWNASGPKTIAATGATCVCIRHRGAFPLLQPGLCIALAGALGYYATRHYANSQLQMTVLIAAGLMAGWMLLARGSASFEDMLDDVATAITWSQANESLNPAGTKLVLGGYSSGGHVLTSLLNRTPSLAAQADGVLLLSGVLGTRPATSPATPRWLTDVVCTGVWGGAWSAIPSPVHTMQALAASSRKANKHNLPRHLLVGCKSETFGIPLLDTFFCRDAYAAAVTRAGGDADVITVDADHWTVLNSDHLFQQLADKMKGGWPAKGR